MSFAFSGNIKKPAEMTLKMFRSFQPNCFSSPAILSNIPNFKMCSKVLRGIDKGGGKGQSFL